MTGPGPDRIVIAARYNGPPGSANGGYACGAVAVRLDQPAEVTLRSPPPLDRPLAVTREGEGLAVHDGDTLVATARPAAIELALPGAVSFAAAEAAAAGYPGFAGHPFPTCFVCGPERAPGDGLRLFAGPVEGLAVAAAPWRPDASVCDAGGEVTTECTWAALDCPSYFGLYAAARRLPRALLGRLAARIDARPRAAERCVALGWSVASEGRKHHVGAALLSEDRGLLAIARGTWIALEA